MPTTTSSSWTRVQNGSNSGSANDFRPFHVGAGAGGRALAEPSTTLGDVHPGRTRRGDLPEGRVRDVGADPVTNRELGPALGLDVLDDALVLARQELGERVAVLVHVVVGIERR